MVRFKKGTKVEVLSKKETTLGAWQCAEIISGNGRMYDVKYGGFHMSSEVEETVERVPRKAIRPCPPPVDGVSVWVEGDLVEVFDAMSWKTAVVVDVVNENIYFVTLLGLSKRLYVHKSHLRLRQCWRDDKWFVLGKASENCGMLVGKGQSDRRKKPCAGDDYSSVATNIDIKKPNVVSATTLKRGSPLDSYDLEAYPIAARKRRVIKRLGSHHQIRLVHPSPTFEKVDEFVYPDKTLGENYVNSSFYNGPAELSGVVTGRGNYSFPVAPTSSVDTESCASSIGSCSVRGSVACNWPFGFTIQHDNDIEDCYSDAESSNALECGGNRCSLTSDEGLGVNVHRSEFQTYCSAVGKLYTSGPLSWEDQEKLTNLRRMLQISDDEHLMVLRNLISANSRMLIS